MPSESVRSLYVASACDLVIAASKFVAAAVTGSSAMISEGIHSIADACNGVLLLWGRRASSKAADAAHPFGYGKELYFWSLLVTILIFAIGGGMSIYEGLSRALHEKVLRDTGWNYLVLGISAVFEAVTVRAAIRDFRKTEGAREFWLAVRLNKDPSVITVLLENIAALVGLAFAFLGIFFGRLLNIPSLDGVASILIGVTLAAVAIVLAVEIKSLLIGEGMDKATLENLRRLAEREPGVIRVGRPLTMYFGPQSVLLALDIEFENRLSAAEVTSTIDRLESSIRKEYPTIQRIFIEAEALSRVR